MSSAAMRGGAGCSLPSCSSAPTSTARGRTTWARRGSTPRAASLATTTTCPRSSSSSSPARPPARADWPLLHRRRRDADPLPPCRAGFLGSLFGGNPPGGAGGTSSASDRRSTPLEDDLGTEDPDEVVLVETDVPSVPGRRCRIVYRNGAPVDAARVEALCAKVGWPQRPRAKLEAALRNSFLVASLHLQVIDEKDGSNGNGGGAATTTAPQTETLVGLARATSDHAFNATIWDVIVDPEYQGQGLGRALVEQVVRALLRREIGNVTLFADARVVEFYRQMGFECDPEGIKGMFWYPR